MLLIIAFLCLSLSVKAQDTLNIRRVRVSKKVQLSRKTNKIVRAWPHWVKVKEGFVVHDDRGLYFFNGQYWKATVDEYKNLLAFTPVK